MPQSRHPYPLNPLKVGYFSAMLGFPISPQGEAAIRARARHYKDYRGGGWAGGRKANERIGMETNKGKSGQLEKKPEKKREGNDESKAEKKDQRGLERTVGNNGRERFTKEEDEKILAWNGTGKSWKELSKELGRGEGKEDAHMLKARARELAIARNGAGAASKEGKKESKSDGKIDRWGEKGKSNSKDNWRDIGTSNVDAGNGAVWEDMSGKKNEIEEKKKKTQKNNGHDGKKGAGHELFDDGQMNMLHRLLQEDEQNNRDQALRIVSRFHDLTGITLHEDDVKEALML